MGTATKTEKSKTETKENENMENQNTENTTFTYRVWPKASLPTRSIDWSHVQVRTVIFVTETTEPTVFIAVDPDAFGTNRYASLIDYSREEDQDRAVRMFRSMAEQLSTGVDEFMLQGLEGDEQATEEKRIFLHTLRTFKDRLSELVMSCHDNQTESEAYARTMISTRVTKTCRKAQLREMLDRRRWAHAYALKLDELEAEYRDEILSFYRSLPLALTADSQLAEFKVVEIWISHARKDNISTLHACHRAEMLAVGAATESNHFENLNSTNLESGEGV